MALTMPAMTYEIAFSDPPMEVNPTWTDVTPYVAQCSIGRGRPNEFSKMATGIAHVVLENADRRFDPTWTGGPYGSEILPMRGFRVSATWNSVPYQLFRGWVESWPLQWSDPADSRVEIDAADAFKVLNLSTITGATFGVETSGDRILAVLNAIGWPAGLSSTALGSFNMAAVPSALSTTNALSYIQTVEASEGYPAAFFASRFGQVVFFDRTRTTPSIAGTFGDGVGQYVYELGAEGPVLNDTDIYNEILAQRAGGTLQVATDATSQSNYAKRTLQLTGLVNDSDADVATLASDALARYKDPAVRLNSLILHPLDDPTHLFPQALGNDLTDRVVVERASIPGGGSSMSLDLRIQGIRHDIAVDDWRTTWQLAPT